MYYTQHICCHFIVHCMFVLLFVCTALIQLTFGCLHLKLPYNILVINLNQKNNSKFLAQILESDTAYIMELSQRRQVVQQFRTVSLVIQYQTSQDIIFS